MKKVVKSGFAAVVLCGLFGCNTYDVRALKYDPAMKEVVVVNNPEVRVSDFEDVLADAFGQRGVAVRREESGYKAAAGEYVVSYTALQSWDFTTYLSDAKVWVNKGNLQQGCGHYHHVGENMSLSFWKWQSTETKMMPLYDALLENYQRK